MNLSRTLAAALVAMSTAGVASASSTLVREGYVPSAPSYNAAARTLDRQQVKAQIAPAVRQNIADPIAAEGRGMVQSQSGSTRTRGQVRSEAIAAVRANIQDPIAAAGERALPRSFAPADVTVGAR